MRNRNFKIVITLAAVLLSLGCQRDDICPGATETTPHLNVEFFDADEPETLKVVQDLVVIAVGEPDTLFGPETTNHIAIPLRTNQNFTEYRFIVNSGSSSENEDIIRFSYNPTPDYLNRACGFKVKFLDLSLNRETEVESWLISHTVQTDNIENEATTHITFTH